MKQLIIARHGHYGKDGHLDVLGKIKIGALAEKIKSLIKDNPVVIFTSPETRARESAEIIAKALKTNFEEKNFLGLEKDDFSIGLDLINLLQNSFKTIIFVTHLEYAEEFPRFFIENKFGIKLDPLMIEKSEAFIIDCVEKTFSHIK